MKLLLLTLCIVTSASAFGLGRKQSAGAHGKLTCHGKPMSGVTVKMYDDDRGLDMDDFMGETKTRSDGTFEVHGSSHEFTTIDPKINIYHDCDDEFTPCQRKISIMLPDKYVYRGDMPDEFYDTGTLELSGKFSGEERDCFH